MTRELSLTTFDWKKSFKNHKIYMQGDTYIIYNLASHYETTQIIQLLCYSIAG